jgi:hypothetical protein
MTSYLGLASTATQHGDQIIVLFELHELAILRLQDDGVRNNGMVAREPLGPAR